MSSSDSDDTSSVVSIPTMAQPENYVPPKERKALVSKDVNVTVSRSSVRWPHLKSLFPGYNKDIKTLLDQVTECDCVNQPLAANSNPKGNKWARLYMVMYGGGTFGRGAFAYSELPRIGDACKLKKKVGEIWKYIVGLNDEDAALVDNVIVETCKRQLQAYESNCAKVNDTTESERKMEASKAQMVGYERQQGAIPPGAKGVPGCGQIGWGNVSWSKTVPIASKDSINIDPKNSGIFTNCFSIGFAKVTFSTGYMCFSRN